MIDLPLDYRMIHFLGTTVLGHFRQSPTFRIFREEEALPSNFTFAPTLLGNTC